MKFTKMSKRIVAATVSAAMACACAGTIKSSASNVIHPISGKPIGYEVYVDKTNTKEVNLRIRVTGMENCVGLSFYVYYDASKCSYTKGDADYENCSFADVKFDLLNEGEFVYVALMGTAEGDETPVISLPFTTKGSASSNMNFSTALCIYKCQDESNPQNNYDYDLTSTRGDTTPDENVSYSPQTHLVGDTDMDGTISLNDAYSVLTILNATNQNEGATNVRNKYTSVINYNLQRLSNGKLFDVNTGAVLYNCGFAIDTDNDNRIDIEDAEAIMYYDSCDKADIALPNNNVGTVRNVACCH